MDVLVKFWLLTGLVMAPAICAPLEPLPTDKLRKFKKEPCVLIVPWANWCAQCVQKLPQWLPQLSTWRRARVVVVDVSSPFSQESISRKWTLLLDAPLQTYLKPGAVSDKGYRREISADWDGALPYAVLYSKSRRLRDWKGSIDLSRITRETESLCGP